MQQDYTVYTHTFTLADNDFDCYGNLRANRAMQFMQDVAAKHIALLGMSWDELDAKNKLWVLSKIRMLFFKQIRKDTESLDVSTWLNKPSRCFTNRCFEAFDSQGNKVFAAFSSWLIIDKTDRKISYDNGGFAIDEKYYPDRKTDVCEDFRRIRCDDEFAPLYSFVVRRSLLDVNGHVNNTCYVTFALDACDGKKLAEAEIVYHKEIKLNDKVEILGKSTDATYVTGQVDGQPCFFAKLTFDD